MVWQRNLDDGRARLAADIVGFALRRATRPIFETNRGSAEICFARQLAMYLTHVGSQMSLARVAVAFNRDRSTVSYACHQIENRRDDPAFDAWVDQLEQVMASALTVEPDTQQQRTLALS